MFSLSEAIYVDIQAGYGIIILFGTLDVPLTSVYVYAILEIFIR